MSILADLVLLGLGALSVWRAWRSGALVAAAAAIGWLAGLWLGLALTPGIVSFMTTSGWVAPQWRALVALGVVLLCAAVFNGLLIMIAAALSRAIRKVPVAKGVDAWGGAVIGLITWAAVVWLVGGFVQSMKLAPLADIAKDSTVVRTLDAVAPVKSDTVVGAIGAAVEASGLPQVFGDAVESIPSIAAPDTTIPKALATTSLSVVEVLADEPACDTSSTGSGWVVAPGRIVTNAHVVAGADSVSVRIGGKGAEVEASVVEFDPETDLAVLHVRGLKLKAIPRGDALGVGEQSYAVGYPEGGPYQVAPARVRAVLEAKGKDIYDEKTVVRQIYSLRVKVQPGNSGGPLLDTKGKVVGMVFARSLDDADTGYALTLAQIAPDLKSKSTTPVSTGECVRD